mgnify:CR=1 FL=1
MFGYRLFGLGSYGLAVPGDRGLWGGTELPSNVIDFITMSTEGNATDFGDLSVSRGQNGGTSNGITGRGVFVGGSPGTRDVIDFVTILTEGNATDFGNMTGARRGFDACSNGTSDRGLTGGGET